MEKKRINRCIELLDQGEYLYYSGAGPLTYENGKKQAKTWADFLMVMPRASRTWFGSGGLRLAVFWVRSLFCGIL